MKKLIPTAIILLFSLQGCYTIILTPEDKTPVYNSFDGFYLTDYYGSYGSYYEIPWWITNPITISNVTSRISATQTIRNNVGNRGESNTRDGIIHTSPPSRDNNPGTITQNQKNSSGNEVRSNNTNSSGNSNSGSIRNENGNRNSGNSRR